MRGVREADVSAALGVDRGPVARLEAVIAAPDTMSVIVQRLTDG